MLVLLEDIGVRVGEEVGVVALKVVDGVVATGVLVAIWFPPTFVGGIMVMETPLAKQRDALRSNISRGRIRLILYVPIEVEVSHSADLTLSNLSWQQHTAGDYR